LLLLPEWFTLYGGTALAIQLGNRESVDFDFFSSQAFDPKEIRLLSRICGVTLVPGGAPSCDKAQFP
jgi:hypothetical protein